MAETNIVKINAEVAERLADKETLATLVATTFKGLSGPNVKQAITEGIIRGFKFEDFLEKNVYAIPYGDKYSLVTSLDYARKIGMRSGIVGKAAPVFMMDGEKIKACSITVKRKIGETIGDFTSTVYFSEYTTNKNLWASKPRTMLAKVAEMHALRMACPEELSQMYTVEEMGEKTVHATISAPIDTTEYKAKIEACKTLDELGKVWTALPGQAKKALVELKDKMKATLK